MARRLCTSYLHPECVEAYNFCCIALNKFPGIRPIGVCEVVRRIIGKAIMTLVKDDIMEATGPTQLCAGQLAGCEAGVHTLHSLFDNFSTEGVLLVDATNAFNQLNRPATLRNIQAICPSLAHILINCYRDPVAMHTSNGEIMKRLADLLSEKWDVHYSKTICLIRCRLSFALLRSAIRCMRGSRSTAGRPAYYNHPDHSEVVLSETALTY